MFGEEARFTCTLADPTGVLQVTWQRGLKPELLENLATYSKRFGEQINSPFAKKVSFNESSLSSSSIVLKNVTWEDENCYVCSFNAYPEGSKRKQICLKVEGIVSTLVSTSNSTTKSGQKVLSCSATGKPAPTVDWDIPPNITRVLQPTAEVSHSNGTFTSSSSITVDKDWTGRVNCVLNKGKNGERREELILPAQPEPGPVEGTHSGLQFFTSHHVGNCTYCYLSGNQPGSATTLEVQIPVSVSSSCLCGNKYLPLIQGSQIDTEEIPQRFPTAR
uniref:OX-2 membrane glycoprotein-like n=1 Tax=Fundulus heteroclitus TaxID=8078 RepID=A0A3Q2PI37_FUNHE